MRMVKTGILNLSLRFVTLASKFVLMLFMARYLRPEDLGVYGILSASIAISLYFLGLDFYVFNTREIIAQDEIHQTRLIRDQLACHALTYVIVLPLLMVVFLSGILSREYMLWFYLLLVLEHLSQESGRLFITLSRPLVANVVYFLRSGAWIYFVIGFYFLGKGGGNLPVILMGWSAGVLSSIALSLHALRRMPWGKVRKEPIDWTWIRRGVFVAMPFLGGTIALRAIEYGDRYFIQYFLGEAMVGVYTFYISFANVVQVFVITGIIQILHPEIIGSFKQNQLDKYRRLIRKMGYLSFFAAVLVAAGIVAGIQPVLRLVGKSVYSNHVSVLWILLGSSVVAIVGSVPNYALYVRGRDKSIFLANVLALAVSLAGNATLVERFALTGAAVTSLASNSTVVLSYLVMLRRGRDG